MLAINMPVIEMFLSNIFLSVLAFLIANIGVAATGVPS